MSWVNECAQLSWAQLGFPFHMHIPDVKDAPFLLEEKINVFHKVFWKGRER